MTLTTPSDTEDSQEAQEMYDCEEAYDSKAHDLPIDNIAAFIDELNVFNPNEVEELSQMFASCVPNTSGKFHEHVFKFARGLRSIPFLAGFDMKDCKPFLRIWHAVSLPYLKHKYFDDTWSEFCSGWKKVKVPLNQDFIAVAIKEAESLPCLELDSLFDSPETRLIIKLCHVMQLKSETDSFYLSARACGKACGLNPKSAWKRLNMLVSEGWLEIVERGRFKRATRFKFIGELHVAEG